VLNSTPSFHTTIPNTTNLTDQLYGTGSFNLGSYYTQSVTSFSAVTESLIGLNLDLRSFRTTPPFTVDRSLVFASYNFDTPSTLELRSSGSTFSFERTDSFDVEIPYNSLDDANYILNENNSYKVSFEWTASFTVAFLHVNDYSLSTYCSNQIGQNSVYFFSETLTAAPTTTYVYSGSVTRIIYPTSTSFTFGINYAALYDDQGITPAYNPVNIKYKNFIIQKNDVASDIQDSHFSDNGFSGFLNLRYFGSKLTGPGINIDTPNTIDGGPVVKITTVNPNQLVFASNQISTIDQSATGTQRRSI